MVDHHRLEGRVHGLDLRCPGLTLEESKASTSRNRFQVEKVQMAIHEISKDDASGLLVKRPLAAIQHRDTFVYFTKQSHEFSIILKAAHRQPPV